MTTPAPYTASPNRHRGATLAQGLLAFLVALFLTACTPAPLENRPQDFLGPLPGVTYEYDAGDMILSVTGLEQPDENTVRVRETMPLPAKLVEQGFPARSERTYLLQARDGGLVEIYRGRETLRLDTAHPHWEMTLDTIVPDPAANTNHWATVESRCQIVSSSTKRLFGQERTVLSVTCDIPDSPTSVRSGYAAGIGLIEQGFVEDGEYLPSLRLIRMH